MEGRGDTPSAESQSSSVLDFSWTYNVSDACPHEHCAEPCEEIQGTLTSTSSGPEGDNTGSPVNVCDENDSRYQIWFNPTSDIGGSSKSNPSDINPTSSKHRCGAADDDEVRETLDSFYELNGRDVSNGEGNAQLRRLSSQIPDLRLQNHTYALRTFQMARVILNRDGIHVLRNQSKDMPFSTPKDDPPSAIAKPVPGISEDVVNFLLNSDKT